MGLRGSVVDVASPDVRRQRQLRPMRNRMLRREVAASVEALAGMLGDAALVER